MNRKILIAVIAVILIIFIALFALPNMQSGETASINFDKNSLEDRGTLTVDSEDISQDKGYYSSSSACLFELINCAFRLGINKMQTRGTMIPIIV